MRSDRADDGRRRAQEAAFETCGRRGPARGLRQGAPARLLAARALAVEDGRRRSPGQRAANLTVMAAD